MEWIEDPNDPRVSAYSLLKSKEERVETFVADHEKTVLRLLHSSFEVPSLFCTEKYFQKHKDLILKRETSGTKIYLASDILMEQTVGFSLHQGMLALGKKRWSQPESLEAPCLFTNGIVDSENMGSLLRTSAALGVRSFAVDGKSASPYLRRSVRVSMGAIFALQMAEALDPIAFLTQQKEKKTLLVALSLPKNSFVSKQISLYDALPKKPFLLVVGNEAYGIEETILDLVDYHLYIPMQDGIDSLNVSHATAIALSYLIKD